MFVNIYFVFYLTDMHNGWEELKLQYINFIKKNVCIEKANNNLMIYNGLN